ncbi:MAG: DUF2892 domain-containing protein [Parvularculaceae bacterium]
MKANMGTIDRIVRLIFAAVVAYLYFTHRIDGLTATILAVLAAVFLLTSLVGFCPLYAPFGFSTRKKQA